MSSKIFTCTIWMLSFVSLFADVSSEMLYPVIPIYLQSIGFTALWIGILEGMAEAAAGLSKGYFGKLSDQKGVRMPFVRVGYFLSGIAKPAMIFFTAHLWVLFVRSTDRLGKGIRTGARDAVLSDACSKENKGKVFGLHRAMDTIGAAIGPVFALAYLHYHPGKYIPLFLIAFAPAMLSAVLTFLVKEKNQIANPTEVNPSSGRNSFFSYLSYWKESTPEYKQVVTGLLLFALFNSSDFFLLLMVKHIGMTDTDMVTAYIFYNLVYAIFSYPFGSMADKIGMKKTFVLGLALFCITYAGMAFLQNIFMLFTLFFIYGLFAAVNDGVSKAWIAKIVPKNETATAVGFFASGSSLAVLVASSTAGLIWISANPPATFLISATGAFAALVYFLFRKD